MFGFSLLYLFLIFALLVDLARVRSGRLAGPRWTSGAGARADIRARNRALVVVLVALVALFYASPSCGSGARSWPRGAAGRRRRRGRPCWSWSPWSPGWAGCVCVGAALSHVLRRDRVWRHDPARRGRTRRGSRRLVTVRFDAQTAPDLDWEFRPQTPSVTVHPGEQTPGLLPRHQPQRSAGHRTATYNVTPTKTGIYFDKLQCFCFSASIWRRARAPIWGSCSSSIPTSLKDPDTRDVDTITLSYTMFRAPRTEPARRRPAPKRAGTLPAAHP